MRNMAQTTDIPVPMLFELCSGGTAYEGKPQGRIRIKLDKVLEIFRDQPAFEILAYTPYMLIVKTPSGAEISIRPRGKLLVKRVKSEEEARTAAYETLRIAAPGVQVLPETAQKSQQ